MSEKNNGGPAFPCKKIVSYQTSLFSSEAIPVYEEVGGMTLRDWFAGMALQGVGVVDENVSEMEIAARAYIIADGMIKVRDWPLPKERGK